MAKNNSKSDLVTLRSVTDKGEVDASSLVGMLGDQKVTITTILNNTAVYYLTGKGGRRLLESLEKILVKKSDVKYLPVRENLHPSNKTSTKIKRY